MIIQIYEIQTPEEAEKCIEAGVDHIGSVILSEEDWKNALIKETVGVSSGTLARNSIIPLFNDIDTLSKVIDYYRPDFIHFCETLTSDEGSKADLEKYITIQVEIKQRFPEISIIRSIPIPLDGSNREFPTLSIAQELEPVSDIFLTDTWLGKEPVEGFIGITGKLCDKRLARMLLSQSGIPVILAGGLSPENVHDAVMNIHPAGVDSCTLTNLRDQEGKTVRFKKDLIRVRKFVEEARRAESLLMELKRKINGEIDKLKDLLSDREAALPAHSIRPHQLQIIEKLESDIEAREGELAELAKMSGLSY